MDARSIFRRGQREVVLPTLELDGNDALEVHGIEWVTGFRPNHPDMQPGKVARVRNRGEDNHKNKKSLYFANQALKCNQGFSRRKTGVGDGIRTHDPRSHSPMFYR